MERIIKIFLFGILCSWLFTTPTQAGTDLSTLISPQNIKYSECTKVYNTDNISLLYLTIAAINANRFNIDEIQSKSGYILFTAVNKQFLASISNVNVKQSMLKITPADNNYYFQPGIISNIHKFIDLNINKKIENVNFN